MTEKQTAQRRRFVEGDSELASLGIGGEHF